jgi:hypothetical protein
MIQTKSRRLLAGFAVLLAAAMFTFTLVGCENGSTDPEDPGNGDPSLSGSIIISTTSGGTTATSANTGATLYAVYSGGTETVTYQWNKDGTAIPSGTGISYMPATAGSYTVTVSAPGYQSKNSAAVDVTGTALSILNGNIIISATSDGTTAATTAETGDTLHAVYSGGTETVTYQWNKDGAIISGETGSSYAPSEAGSYTVTVSATGYQSKTSDPCVVSEGSSSLTWTAVADTTFDSSSYIGIQGIAYGGASGSEKFVAVGDHGKAAYSADGVA